MKRTLIYIFLIFPLCLIANDTTIVFKQYNYEELFQLAKKENKFIMLYFHFDGCGACVKMEKNIFTNNEIANFYNNNFLNFEVNTRTTEGSKINEIYNVQMHPTFMFIDSNGEIIHKIVGSYSVDEFLVHGEKVLDPTQTLNYYKSVYESGDFNSDFLFDYAYKLNDANELDSTIIEEYLSLLQYEDYMLDKNILFIYEFMLHKHKVCIPFNSSPYNYMYLNQNRFQDFFDKDQIETRLMFALRHEIYLAIESKNSIAFWELIERLQEYNKSEYEFKEIWGGVTWWTTFPVELSIKLFFYDEMDLVDEYYLTLDEMIRAMWNDSEKLNEWAWISYLNYTDERKLNKATECALRSIQIDQKAYNTDTYAALLFKNAKYDEALFQAKLAVELAKKENKPFEETTLLINLIKEKM